MSRARTPQVETFPPADNLIALVIGARCRELRLKRGLSQRAAAPLCSLKRENLVRVRLSEIVSAADNVSAATKVV